MWWESASITICKRYAVAMFVPCAVTCGGFRRCSMHQLKNLVQSRNRNLCVCPCTVQYVVRNGGSKDVGIRMLVSITIWQSLRGFSL
jgi:hypothetical protein